MTILLDIALPTSIFDAHRGGKLSTGLTAPLATARDLAIAYTPGVAEVSRAIASDPAAAAEYTWANRLVVVVSDGTAVLGLGDIGPRGRAAGDGGQVGAVQGVRRARLHPDRARHHRRRRDRRDDGPAAAELRRGEPGGRVRAALLRAGAPG